MLFRHPVLPDIVRQNIDSVRVGICKGKNIGVKMILMAVADKNHQRFGRIKGRQDAAGKIK